MGAKRFEDILGLEYDWLGVDSIGSVAVFSTAGGGAVPTEFLLDTDSHDAAFDAVMAGPPTATARKVGPEGQGTWDFWRSAAERGLFAYDADFFGGPYQLVAAPSAAAKLEHLPNLVATVAIRLPNLEIPRFSN